MLAAIALAAGLLAGGCQREEKGGKGGNAVLKVTPQHHGVDMSDCVIYLKYASQTPPSETTDGYDENVACVMENGKPTATFTGLRNGKYYIYGYGYDPAVAQNVKGGIPYEIKSQGTIPINIPVTEGD